MSVPPRAPVEAAAVHAVIAAVWRMESAQLIGGLTRRVGDLGLAEDLAQEALLLALQHWPETGVPDNPGAWLMTAAKNRGLDHFRHVQMRLRKQETVATLSSPDEQADPAESGVGDDTLRLMFIACHPILPVESRVALTLRMLGGLTTSEIARALLQPEPTVAQRIVRAKRTLSAARVLFELPPRAELGERVTALLEVIYLIFNEGYAASRGEDWLRPALCEDALRLGRCLAALMPDHSEIQGLLALMELHASRHPSRVDAKGRPILLLDQDRGAWDQLLIVRGLHGLHRAAELARHSAQPLGPYALQAAISACHARARTAAQTDWQQIVALYDALLDSTQSPVVALNRAVAVSMAEGPQVALLLVEELREEPALKNYRFFHAVRGDLLQRGGHPGEASAAFVQAAALTENAQERALMTERARQCDALLPEPTPSGGSDPSQGEFSCVS